MQESSQPEIYSTSAEPDVGGGDLAPPKSSSSGLRLIIQTYKMGIEEQQEEREVLEAIFPEEITGW